MKSYKLLNKGIFLFKYFMLFPYLLGLSQLYYNISILIKFTMMEEFIMLILTFLYNIFFYYYMVAIPFVLYKKMTTLPPKD